MAAEFTRTITTSSVTVSAPGKKPLTVAHNNPQFVADMYAATHEIPVNTVKVDVKEETTTYKMTLETFLKHATPVVKPEPKS